MYSSSCSCLAFFRMLSSRIKYPLRVPPFRLTPFGMFCTLMATASPKYLPKWTDPNCPRPIWGPTRTSLGVMKKSSVMLKSAVSADERTICDISFVKGGEEVRVGRSSRPNKIFSCYADDRAV